VEILQDAETDRERAIWLETVPEGIVQRDLIEIDRILRDVGFVTGRGYLSALFAKNNARRLAGGRYPWTVLTAVEHARLLMWEAVRQGELKS
jgi:hypothetical protein